MAFIQQVLSTIMDRKSNVTVTDNATPESPFNLGSLLSLFLSLSALRDWLKLIVVGGLLETCRRLLFSSYNRLIDSFFITANFQENDSSYDWMMVWLSQSTSWTQARDLQISTQTFGLDSSAVLVPGEDAASLVSASRKLAYLPSMSSTQTLWYKGRWMSVTRSQTDSGYYGRREDTLQISILTRHQGILNELLLEAKKDYMAAQESTISIHVSDSSNNWRHVASRSKRPLRSIVLDPGIKDLLVDDAHDFLESKSWYAARGIPFRRGYLLYGAPGSGKTSIIHSLAGELGLAIYIISLSRSGLDDTALSELISDLPEKCIALMEDIDAAFTTSLNRDTAPNLSSSPTSPEQVPSSPGNSTPDERTMGRGVSLSGLLNALDGVGAQEGRILFATTNKYESLDPALTRPGRIDIHVEFKLASKHQAAELYRCFYLPTEGDNEVADDDDKEKKSVDPGDISDPPSPIAHPVSPSPSEMPTVAGRPRRARAPKLSRSKITSLADQFSDGIPEREFSMASLQGYLMAYKTRPFDAVKDVSGWVAKNRLHRASSVGSGP